MAFGIPFSARKPNRAVLEAENLAASLFDLNVSIKISGIQRIQ